MDLAARTDQLFTAFAAADLETARTLCSPGLVAKQNVSDEFGLDRLMAFVARMPAMGVTVAYSDVRRVVADDAVTEQHLVTLTREDGTTASSDVCVILRYDDEGLVVRLDEYLDPTAFAAVLS